MLNEAVSDMAARHVLAHWRQQACDPGARFHLACIEANWRAILRRRLL